MRARLEREEPTREERSDEERSPEISCVMGE